MRIIGVLIIVGILFWVFIVTLPFLWWLWVLILGIVIYLISIHRKDIWQKKKKQKEFEENVKHFGDDAPLDIKNL